MKKAVIYLRVSTLDQARKGLDMEGYSIPAQREACHQKAEELGAEVVREFVDRGESAKFADRTELQAMLKFVHESKDVDLAIFHRIDRLARNTRDYANMKYALLEDGVRLVSVSEHIDDSASGKFMERMLANMAEYYVDNLSDEVIKGATIKARLGRTPYKAPLGYVNARQIVEGHEVKTVVLDPERAELVRFAFEQYATGQYSLVHLVDILDAKGLTARPHKSSGAKSLGVSGLNVLLRNEYYAGKLKYRGIAYDGKHEPIVPPDLFQRVQDMLKAKLAGDRSRKYDHYLRSTIYCGRCGFRLCFTYGKTYPYYFCVGKTTKYASCDLPYLPVAEVEQVIERQYRWVYLSGEEASDVKAAIHGLLKDDRETANKEVTRQTTRIQQLTASRHKLMQLFYAGKLTDDLVAQEQQQLAKDIRQAESSLKMASRDVGDLEKHVEAAIELMKQASSAYKVAPDIIRKRINQAIFERILVDRVDDEIKADGKAAEPFNTLRNVKEALATQKLALKTQKSTKGSKLLGEAFLFGSGSNSRTLVDLDGFQWNQVWDELHAWYAGLSSTEANNTTSIVWN